MSQDPNIPPLLEAHPHVELVASHATLQCLADSGDPKRRWMIPVVVLGRSPKNVAFLDDPFEDHEVSSVDLAGYSYQDLLRATLCRHEGIKFGRSEAPGLRSVSYKVWNVKKTSCQGNLMKTSHAPIELNVLVRGQMDACEEGANGSLCPVVLRPKLETQLRYGAQLPSRSQLCREWAQLFFTPFSSLCRGKFGVCPVFPTNWGGSSANRAPQRGSDPRGALQHPERGQRSAERPPAQAAAGARDTAGGFRAGGGVAARPLPAAAPAQASRVRCSAAAHRAGVSSCCAIIEHALYKCISGTATLLIYTRKWGTRKRTRPTSGRPWTPTSNCRSSAPSTACPACSPRGPPNTKRLHCSFRFYSIR